MFRFAFTQTCVLDFKSDTLNRRHGHFKLLELNWIESPVIVNRCKIKVF